MTPHPHHGSTPSAEGFRRWAMLSPTVDRTPPAGQPAKWLPVRLPERPAEHAGGQGTKLHAQAPVESTTPTATAAPSVDTTGVVVLPTLRATTKSPLMELPPWAIRLLAMQQCALFALQKALRAARADAKALVKALADSDTARACNSTLPASPLHPSPAPRACSGTLGIRADAFSVDQLSTGAGKLPPPVCPVWAEAEALSLLLDLLNWMLKEGPAFSHRAFWIEGVPRAAAMLSACGALNELDVLRRLIWQPRCMPHVVPATSGFRTPSSAHYPGVEDSNAATPIELRTELRQARDRLNLRLMRTHIPMAPSSSAAWADAAASMFAWLSSLPSELPSLPLSIFVHTLSASLPDDKPGDQARGASATSLHRDHNLAAHGRMDEHTLERLLSSYSTVAPPEEGGGHCTHVRIQLNAPIDHHLRAINDTQGVIRLRLLSKREFLQASGMPVLPEPLPAATPREWGCELSECVRTPPPRGLVPPTAEHVLQPGEEIPLTLNEMLREPLGLAVVFDAKATGTAQLSASVDRVSVPTGQSMSGDVSRLNVLAILLPQRIDGISQYGNECEPIECTGAAARANLSASGGSCAQPSSTLVHSVKDVPCHGNTRGVLRGSPSSPDWHGSPRQCGSAEGLINSCTAPDSDIEFSDLAELSYVPFSQEQDGSSICSTSGPSVRMSLNQRLHDAASEAPRTRSACRADDWREHGGSPLDTDPDMGGVVSPKRMTSPAARYTRRRRKCTPVAAPWQVERVELRFRAAAKAWATHMGTIAEWGNEREARESQSDANAIQFTVEASSSALSESSSSDAMIRMQKLYRNLDEAARHIAALSQDHAHASSQALRALDRLPPRSDAASLEARLQSLESLLCRPTIGTSVAAALESQAAEWLCAIATRVVSATHCARSREVRGLRAPRLSTIQMALSRTALKHHEGGGHLCHAARRIDTVCNAIHGLSRPSIRPSSGSEYSLDTSSNTFMGVHSCTHQAPVSCDRDEDPTSSDRSGMDDAMPIPLDLGSPSSHNARTHPSIAKHPSIGYQQLVLGEEDITPSTAIIAAVPERVGVNDFGASSNGDYYGSGRGLRKPVAMTSPRSCASACAAPGGSRALHALDESIANRRRQLTVERALLTKRRTTRESQTVSACDAENTHRNGCQPTAKALAAQGSTSCERILPHLVESIKIPSARSPSSAAHQSDRFVTCDPHGCSSGFGDPKVAPQATLMKSKSSPSLFQQPATPVDVVGTRISSRHTLIELHTMRSLLRPGWCKNVLLSERHVDEAMSVD